MRRSHRESVAVVGGGIAGVLAARLLSKKGLKVEIFEKHSKLGGCAGSFSRDGLTYNVGATTVPGLLQGFPLREFFEESNLMTEVELVEPSIVVHTRKGQVKRYSDLERTLDEIERVFPNRGNREFWSLVHGVTRDILSRDYYHNFSSPAEVLKSLFKMRGLTLKYYRLYMTDALEGLRSFYQNIDSDYLSFMDGHVKIVAQCSIREVNMITLLLSLGYPFTGVGYAKNGMGQLISLISKDIHCNLNTEVTGIKPEKGGYILRGKSFEEKFSRVVIAMPIFENLKIIDDRAILKYLSKFLRLQQDNSAVILYGVLEGFHPQEVFHLCLLDKPLPFTTSAYLFFSFTPKSMDGKITFTASTHTSTGLWKDLSKEEYERRKTILTELIIEELKRVFSIDRTCVRTVFLATPESFYRYLRRRSVGGIPVKRENSIWRIPSNFTPFKRLYLAGDSFFCYQGWIGVSMGVRNLVRNFDENL